jgi:hypothetical protein
MSENIVEHEDDDLETLMYKHIVLRRLQKSAIASIDELESKNLMLTNEIIELKKTVQTLTESSNKSTMLMVKALTVNNTMKDDYRMRIQKLEEELLNFKK